MMCRMIFTYNSVANWMKIYSRVAVSARWLSHGARDGFRSYARFYYINNSPGGDTLYNQDQVFRALGLIIFNNKGVVRWIILGLGGQDHGLRVLASGDARRGILDYA